MLLFWFLLLSVFTYYLMQRSIAPITRTPTWLLWLVVMTPLLFLTTWSLVQGDEQPPTGLVLSLFILCPILYWGLIQAGRRPTPTPTPSTSDKADQVGDASALAQTAKKAELRPINKQEEADLQHCFPWSVYFLQNIEYRPQAMICRGQLRTSPNEAYDTVSDNVKRHFGDRFLVVFQEGLNGKPFFALVPNPQAAKTAEAEKTGGKRAEPLARPGLAIALLLTTLFTTTAAGVFLSGVSDEQIQENPDLFLTGLPYALALLAILGTHEMGHYLAARHYKIQATLPYFIPIPFFLGTFGAFIQMRSPVPNRRALFDVGIAGPLSGLVMAVPLLLFGLTQSEIVPISDNTSLLNFESLDPSASVMLALLSKLALGSQISADQAISLSPIAIAGCLGLVVTALNLMPVGQLDGGHIVHAMYGQRTGAIIGQVARVLVLLLALIHREFMLWAILLFFIPAVDEPALNDVSELNPQRDILGLVSLVMLVLIVLPAPQSLSNLLF